MKVLFAKVLISIVCIFAVTNICYGDYNFEYKKDPCITGEVYECVDSSRIQESYCGGGSRYLSNVQIDIYDVDSKNRKIGIYQNSMQTYGEFGYFQFCKLTLDRNYLLEAQMNGYDKYTYVISPLFDSPNNSEKGTQSIGEFRIFPKGTSPEQNSKIIGQVHREDDDINEITVSIKGKKTRYEAKQKTAQSDWACNFSFENLPADTYFFKAKKGKMKYKRKIKLEENMTYIVNAYLKAK